MSVALSLVNLSHRYSQHADWAITDVCLDAQPGETLALLGPSGCGKTTILKIIAGLIRPTQGEVHIDGVSITDVAPESRPAAMIFQQPLLFGHLSVIDNVAFGLRMRGIGKRARRARAREFLARVQTEHLADRRPSTLSGGEQSRVALARALITHPQLLLLDEPLSALDPALRDDMRALLARLQSGATRTTVFVTHDQLEAVLLADRIALILDGRLQMLGRPSDFYERPVSRRVAEFFGAANFIQGRVGANGEFHTDAGVFRVNGRHVKPERPALATIRPENIQAGEGENALCARVTHVVYRGSHARYTLEVAGLALQADWPPDTPITTDDSCMLRLPPDKLWILPESS